MKILFICTHNRCRSILSEAVTNHFGKGKIKARSAGSSPAGKIHPLSLKYLEAQSISTQNLQSESWDTYEHWKPDVVITVCNSAANETCPLWFDDTIQVHWALEDPSSLDDSDSNIEQAFNDIIETLKQRMLYLIGNDIKVLDRLALIKVLYQAESLYP